MSDICYVVLNPEQKNRKKKFQKIFLTDLWPFFDYVFLLPLWKYGAKLAGPIELKFSGSSKEWIWRLFRKFRPGLTPFANFTGQWRLKMVTKIRNTYFYCHFENVQPNWLDRSCWNFQDRQRGGFEGCIQTFVLIWHLWPILQADKGQKWQQKYVIRIFIATLKMYSLTDWADRAEIFKIVKRLDLRTVQKISSRSDTYGRF